MLSLCSVRSLLRKTTRSSPVSGRGRAIWSAVLLLSVALSLSHRLAVVSGAQVGPLGVVNAASFTTPVAPDSIAAAFGTGMATGVFLAPAVPLPTSLGGTTLTVNGQSAGLFFVAASQINFLVPKVAIGTATVEVRLNNVVVARGTVEIRAVAPAIFTANASGLGVPAAQVYRGSPTPQIVYECVPGRSPSCLPRTIDICGVNGQVIIVLYLTGIRGAPDPNNDGNVSESVQVNFGGTPVTPLYAGAQPGFVGLDQINVAVPMTLANTGRITVTVSVTGGAGSNPVELEFISTGTVQVNSFNPINTLAGQVVNITGAGFSAAKEKNLVRILGTDVQTEAQVVDATATQLTVLIPFGVQTGKVSVTNSEGGCGTGTGFSPTNMAVKTSVSGFFKDTSPQARKLKGVIVRVKDATGITKTGVTNDEGAFIIPEPAPGNAEVEIDGGMAQGGLPFPKVLFKMRLDANRDNEVKFPGSLQEIKGATSFLDPDGFPNARVLSVAASPDETQGKIVNGGVTLDIPDNATIRFPDGTSAGNITLSLVARSLTPVPLPERQFSSTIVQIAPIGATINPGAKLTFPNSDGFPAGSSVRLFRLDQKKGSDTLGTFIDSGPATVSADGKQIETPAGAVTETTFYFVSVLRPVVTVVGNVVEIDQVPVRRALLGSRGQSGFTDGNGGFVVRNVPINSTSSLLPDGAVVQASSDGQAVVGADVISLEANYLRPTRVVSRKENNNVPPGSAGGLTPAGVLVLDPPPSLDPPKITAPSSFRVFAGQTQTLDIVVTRGGGQSVTVSVTGANFVTITEKGNDTYTLRLAPGANDVGTYTLVITAVNDIGRVATFRISPLTVSP